MNTDAETVTLNDNNHFGRPMSGGRVSDHTGIGNAECIPKVLIVAEHASFRFGGEAALPLHYFRVLRQRNADVWLIVHARTRDELAALYPGDPRILFVEDTRFDRALWRLSRFIPDRISNFSLGLMMRMRNQWVQRRLARRLIETHGIEVVHQPIPVSPRDPSLMFGLGVPVVIGPMNGGMNFPPAFRNRENAAVRSMIRIARGWANAMNALIPGKRRADAILVANSRTRDALPAGCTRHVIEIVENGVDLTLWKGAAFPRDTGVATFVFMGRLVDWKAADLLLLAFSRAAVQAPMRLIVAGDGAERPALEHLARQLDIHAGEPVKGKVHFAGWKSQAECAEILRASDALVLTSLFECGGAVVLEAMAAGLPVIATDWGGPADYLDESCGILLKPDSRDGFVAAITDALVTLASSPEKRRAMGAAGAEKARRDFDWERKVDTMVRIYTQVIRARAEAAHPAGGVQQPAGRAVTAMPDTAGNTRQQHPPSSSP